VAVIAYFNILSQCSSVEIGKNYVNLQSVSRKAAEIRTGYLRNASLELYRYTKLLDNMFYRNQATSWTAGVRILSGAGYFLFATTSRSTVGPTQPPIQ
jgi:hypothetical protein